MKILQIINSLDLGGAEKLVVDMSNAFTERGHEVYIISLFTAQSDINKRRLNSKVTLIELNHKIGLHFKLLFALSSQIKKIQPDVIHTHLAYAILHTFFYQCTKISTKGNNIHTIHGAADVEFPSRLRFVYHIFIFIFKYRIIAISYDVARSIKEFYAYEAPVIYNGVLLPRENASAVAKNEIDEIRGQGYNKIFITNSRILPIKNQFNLVRAFASVENSGLKYALVHIGEISDNNYYNSIFKEKSANVFFLGVKENVSDYLKKADFFILTSVSEGLGIAVLEAVAVGLIPICTQVGGLKEIVEDQKNGFLIKGTDSDSIYKRVCEIGALSKERLEEIKSKLHENFEKRFSIDVCVGKYLLLYEK